MVFRLMETSKCRNVVGSEVLRAAEYLFGGASRGERLSEAGRKANPRGVQQLQHDRGLVLSLPGQAACECLTENRKQFVIWALMLNRSLEEDSGVGRRECAMTRPRAGY